MQSLHRCHLAATLPLAVTLLLLSCSSEEAPGLEVGSACTEDAECGTEWCFTDPTFPGAYCSKNCSGDNACPDGATCHQYQAGIKLCMAPCNVTADCRQGYYCGYGACVPPCINDKTCRTPDTCFKGTCQRVCSLDSDCDSGRVCEGGICIGSCKNGAACGSGKRCQKGHCVPPCKKDTECLPGQRCDTGKGACVAKPGKAMGAKCGDSSECSTGYCLPDSKICSVKCTGTAKCPSGYVCGLEKVDKDKNGSYDDAEADCLPNKGTGKVASLCGKNADCASNHCYNGFCMEGCVAGTDCGTGQHCAQVNLLVGGGIPKYKGCLPKKGTGSMTLGTFTSAQYIQGLDIPPGAASFALSAKIPSQTEVPYISSLKNPSGTVVSEVKGSCDYYSVPNRYAPDREVSTLLVPNSSAVKLSSGMWTYTLSTTNANIKTTVTLQLKMGEAQKGTVNLNWIFLNMANTCLTGPLLNAASAPTHAWLGKLRNNLRSILSTSGLTVGKETYKDLKSASLDVIDVDGTSNELGKLFATSAGTTGKSINIFLVRSIKSQGTGGIVLGIAGGIPGPPGFHGTVNSGVAMSMQTTCYEKYGYNPAHTMAHELGHFLGLSHNLENVNNPGYSNNQVVCPCPCKANMTCFKESGPFGYQWCRGKDNIPDTDESTDNLMYYAAESTEMFKGNKLSKGQIRVVLNNPLVGH